MKDLFRKYVWTRRIFVALIIVSPAIFSFVASRIVQMTMDRRSTEIKAERNTLEARIKELDRSQAAVASRQLTRAATLGTLNNEDANLAAKLKVDRLFRLEAQGDLRRILADLHPSDWKARISPIDAVLATDYDRDRVPMLQDFENDTLQRAGAKLTHLQAEVNVVSDRDEAAAVRSERIRLVLDLVGVLLTIVAFVARENKLGETPSAAAS